MAKMLWVVMIQNVVLYSYTYYNNMDVQYIHKRTEYFSSNVCWGGGGGGGGIKSISTMFNINK